jgi:hypothetical protein
MSWVQFEFLCVNMTQMRHGVHGWNRSLVFGYYTQVSYLTLGRLPVHKRNHKGMRY